jgi:hypothetical protein
MNEKIIEQTQKWIKSVVIDCNFCPFAAKVFFEKKIHYVVKSNVSLMESLNCLKEELNYLQNDINAETSFIIFPTDFLNFGDYLNLVRKAERLLIKENLDSIFQIASFHPDYCFADSDSEDSANYTNRSIYPMLHILREDSLTKVLKMFPNPEQIPINNVDFARMKGLKYMQMLRTACM